MLDQRDRVNQADELERVYRMPAVPEQPVTKPEQPEPPKRLWLSEVLAKLSIDPLGLLDTAMALSAPPRPPTWGIGLNPAALTHSEQVRLRTWDGHGPGLPSPLSPEERVLLVLADELLTDPKRWIRGHEANDRLGQRVSPLSKGAYAFCAVGALYHVVGNAGDAYRHLEQWLDGMSYAVAAQGSIVGVNDRLGYLDVRKVFGATRAYFNVPREVVRLR